MFVNGKEIKFRRTVQAFCELSDIVPDGNHTTLAEIMDGNDYRKSAVATAKFIIALNRGYEFWKKFEDPGHEPSVITFDEIMQLDPDDFKALLAEALAAYASDGKTEIQTQEPKPQKGVKKNQ